MKTISRILWLQYLKCSVLDTINSLVLEILSSWLFSVLSLITRLDGILPIFIIVLTTFGKMCFYHLWKNIILIVFVTFLKIYPQNFHFLRGEILISNLECLLLLSLFHSNQTLKKNTFFFCVCLFVCCLT